MQNKQGVYTVYPEAYKKTPTQAVKIALTTL